MQAFATDSWLLDLQFHGQAQYIAAAVLATSDGLLLVDPGPSTTLDALDRGLAADGHRLQDVRAVLLTHIHLDHAGVSGTLARMIPGLQVHVHERGAPHLLAPDRLLASATRIYGDRMGPLWGEFLPVPEDQLKILSGGERLTVGGRTMAVAHTPGHAWHHVSYHDLLTGTVFVGDIAGERFPGTPPAAILPTLPPPDIDLEAWGASIGMIRSWFPERLFLTHFGPFSDVTAHLDSLEGQLGHWSAWVRASLDGPGDDATRARAFADHVLGTYRDALPAGVSDRAHLDAVASGWYGLARYWRKRVAARAREEQA